MWIHSSRLLTGSIGCVETKFRAFLTCKIGWVVAETVIFLQLVFSTPSFIPSSPATSSFTYFFYPFVRKEYVPTFSCWVDLIQSLETYIYLASLNTPSRCVSTTLCYWQDWRPQKISLELCGESLHCVCAKPAGSGFCIQRMKLSPGTRLFCMLGIALS